MVINQQDIKELVRERYGARAQRVIELSPVAEHGADEHTDGLRLQRFRRLLRARGHGTRHAAVQRRPVGRAARGVHRGVRRLREPHGAGRAASRRAGAGPGFRRRHRLLPFGAAGGRNRARHRLGHDTVHAGTGAEEPGQPRVDQRGVRAGRNGSHAPAQRFLRRNHLQLRSVPVAGQGRRVQRELPGAGPPAGAYTCPTCWP